jgi:hypothetical protein
MAVVTFTYPVTKNSIGACTIDAFVSEQYEWGVDVTDIPVEDGDNVNDNAVEQPVGISVEAFIGCTEFAVLEGGNPDPNNIPQDDPKARIKQKHEELLRLVHEKQPLDVVMGLDTFHNMVITSYVIPRDVETGADLSFSMTFKQVSIIKSEKTQINGKKATTTNQGTAPSKKVFAADKKNTATGTGTDAGTTGSTEEHKSKVLTALKGRLFPK